MAERPSLGRDDSYNRVTVSRDLKSQIMSMIDDSSESLPLNTVDEDDEDEANKKEPGKLAPPATNGSDAATGGSKLAAEPINAGDFATPTPEKPNPLEQVATVRVDSHKNGSRGGDVASDLATASPMRSHDRDGPELGKLGKRISRMVTHSDTNVAGTDGEKARDNEGETASRATTATQGSTSVGGKVRPGMDKRQSTMKRISSAFKRSVSKNQ